MKGCSVVCRGREHTCGCARDGMEILLGRAGRVGCGLRAGQSRFRSGHGPASGHTRMGQESVGRLAECPGASRGVQEGWRGWMRMCHGMMN